MKLLRARALYQGDLSAMISSVLDRTIQHEEQVVIFVGERLVQTGLG
jgi:hypothetical protein